MWLWPRPCTPSTASRIRPLAEALRAVRCAAAALPAPNTNVRRLSIGKRPRVTIVAGGGRDIIGYIVAPSPREEILRRLRERIVAYAASHLSRDAAEDLAQETLILLHEKYGHVQKLEELLPLALQIVRFKMMGLRRKALRHGEYTQVSIADIQIPDLESNPADYVERKEMLGRLTRALAQLGPRCRELMRLKLLGKTFAEIQKEMGAGTINTVYTWDFRCRKELLERMGGDWEGRK